MENYLVHLLHCSLDDLHKSHTKIIEIASNQPYLKIVSYKEAIIICCDKTYTKSLENMIESKNKDQLFELPFVYGQTIHYLYQEKNEDVHLPFEVEMISKDTFHLYEKYDNAIDETTKIAIVAKNNDEIMGVVGASELSDGLYEIGVDVCLKYRGQGIASLLVRRLASMLAKQKIQVLYSASTTNLGSQQVAYYAGFKPVFVSTFGTIGDENDPYAKERRLLWRSFK